MDLSKIEKYLSECKVDGSVGENEEINEKFYGFGTNGTVEVYGSTVVINKNGRSVEMTKKELVDILLKLGIAKKRQ